MSLSRTSRRLYRYVFSDILEEHVGRVYRKYNVMFNCIHCVDNPNSLIYASRDSLWKHCLENHSQLFPARSDELLRIRETYEEECQIQAYVYMISTSVILPGISDRYQVLTCYL